MKNIKDYINKQVTESKETKYEFNSHVTDSPKKFNEEFIVDSAEWIQSRFPILLKYAREISNKRKSVLQNNKDIEFVKKWIIRCETAYERNETGKTPNTQSKEFLWACNGEPPYFGNAKFTYDLLNYALTKTDLTKPARQKVEKIIREYYKVVEENKNDMNWY